MQTYGLWDGILLCEVQAIDITHVSQLPAAPANCTWYLMTGPASAMTLALVGGKITEVARALPADIQQQVTAAKGWADARARRNSELDGSLWAVDTASPLNPAQQAAYRSYRAALHRVTVDFASPDAIVWPVAPKIAYPAPADRFTAEVDRQVDTKSKALITPGGHKAKLYAAKAAEVKDYRSLSATLLAAIDLAGLQARFPTLMSMVAVWVPAATTAATQRTALGQMVTKVEAGIAGSEVRLRAADAIGNKAKEDIRSATSDAARTALLNTATAAIAAV